ncbi:hypothetical protein HN747_02930 [archaeon]|jgi:hypothetical protein|nr:hypothetical protein [archaeon]
MRPKAHIFYGTIAAIVLYFLGISPVELFLFWISSWLLIDTDHFIYTSISKKTVNPLKIIMGTFRESKIRTGLSKKKSEIYKYPIFAFHNIETLILIFILALFYNIAYFALAGFLFHLSLDYIQLILRGRHFLSKTSIIYVVLRNKNKKRLVF